MADKDNNHIPVKKLRVKFKPLSSSSSSSVTTTFTPPPPPPPQQQPQQPPQLVNYVVEDEDDDDLEEGEFRVPTQLEPPETKPEAKPEAEPEAEEEAVVNVKKYDCKYCNKPFQNGKALGGHLRIHAAERDDRPLKAAGGGYSAAAAKKAAAGGVGSSSGARDQDQDGIFQCNYPGCNKVLKSKKALFGHMRSHPDRDYRGMEPPSNRVRVSPIQPSNNDNEIDNGSGSGGDDGSGEEVVNRMELLRWKGFGKRGMMKMDPSDTDTDTGTGTGSSSSSDNSHHYDDDDEVAATDNLMYLSNGPTIEPDQPEPEPEDGVRAVIKAKVEKKKKGEYDEDELYFLQYELNITVVDTPMNFNQPTTFDYSPRKENKKKRKAVKGSEQPNQSKHHKKEEAAGGSGGGSGGNGGGSGGGENNNQDEEAETVVREVVVGPDGEVLKWICITCGKGFSTHQALGGHRSSHNKEKANLKKSQPKSTHVSPNPNPNPNLNPSSSSTALTLTPTLTLTQVPPRSQVLEHGSGLTQVGPGEIRGDVAYSVHKCNICNESFQSGQALGGHMRCHYVQSSSPPLSSTPPPLSPPQVSSSPPVQTTSKSRPIIDLNEEPDVEEDVDGVVESN